MTAPLWKRCARHAALAQANVVSGAVACLSAALVWSPLPLVLWGVGASIWIFHASTSLPYARKLIQAERDAEEHRARATRDAEADALTFRLHQEPLSTWIRAGKLADDAARYRELERTADQISHVLSSRPELALEWSLDLRREVARLLETYLQLARARLAQLEILAESPAPQPAPGAPAMHAVMPFPDVALRLREVDREMARLQQLVEREPAAATIRRGHIELLERRKAQLVECAARDQKLAAQLEALVDVFRFLLERVSGTDVDSSAISEYMGGVVEQVEETRRAVEAAPPAPERPQAARAAVH